MAAPNPTSSPGSAKKTRNTKKRKSNVDDESGSPISDIHKKKKQESDFTDIAFKVMFRETNTTFAGEHER